jgi:hypothetical protein
MIQDSCQCGEVRYEADGDISDLSRCHCSMCRTLHGAAYATFARVARDGFRWSAGEDSLKTYASSDAIDRLFRGNCGSQLLADFKPGPDVLYLTMGTVDGNPDYPPDYHRIAGSNAPWPEITDGKPQFDAWPDEGV